MRNLKKVLSLALALVMLLGMMMVGAGAATTGFGDDAQIKDSFKEAAAVNKALGLMEGDGTNLNPTANITRAEAFILSLRVDGSNANTLAANWPVTEKPFNDVSMGKWYAPYMAYGKAMGELNGTNGNYDPDGNISVVGYAVMLLRRLGFDADGSRYTGANWDNNAIADGANIGLFEGLNTVSYKTHELTREEACQMVFNALFYSPAGEIGYKIVGSEPAVTITFPSLLEAVLAQSQLETKGKIEETIANDSLAAKVWNLTRGTDTDAFGRTVDTWEVDGKEVYASSSSSATPAKTFTKKVSSSAMAKELKGYEFDELEKQNVITNGAAEEEDSEEASAQITSTADLAGKTGNGKVVEVYTDGKKVTKVIIVSYTVGEVKSITEKNGKTTYKINNTSKFNDEDNTNVILEGDVEEGDIVTFATVGSKWYVYPTTSFEGNQTAKKTSSGTVTVTVGGDNYVLANGVTGVDEAEFANSKNDATYFVDVNGYIVAVADLEEAPDIQYAMIVKLAGKATAGDLDNDAGYSVSARAVLADGTIADYELAVKKAAGDEDDDDEDWTGDALEENDLYSGNVKICGLAGVEGLSEGEGLGLVGYSINKKGQMVLDKVAAADGSMAENTAYAYTNSNSDEDDAKYTGGTSNTDGTATALFTNKTVFVLYNVDGSGKWTAEEAVTGTANLKKISITKDNLAAVITGKDATGTASVAFLKGEALAAAVDYVFVDASEDVKVLKDDATVQAYTGIAADGSEVEVWAEEAVANSGLYPYNEDGELGEIKVATDAEAHTGAPAANGFYLMTVVRRGNLIKVGTDFVDMDAAEVVFIDDTDDEVMDGQKVLVVMDKADTVAAVFVIEAAPTEGGEGDEGGDGDSKTACTLKNVKVDGGSALSADQSGNYAASVTKAKGGTFTVAAESDDGTVEITTTSNKGAFESGTFTVGNDGNATTGDVVFTITVTPTNSDMHESLSVTLTVTLTVSG